MQTREMHVASRKHVAGRVLEQLGPRVNPPRATSTHGAM
jgi:hypothetical protein